jgi:hypothetical protein
MVLDSPPARRHQRMRYFRAAVAQRPHRPVGVSNQQYALDAEIGGHEIARPRKLGLVCRRLPRVKEYGSFQSVRALVAVGPTRKALHACAPRLGGRPRRGRRELTRENRLQVRHGAPSRGAAIDGVLRTEREILPEHFQHPDESERDAVGIELMLTARLDQASDELAHQRRKALVLLSANVVVFLPRTGLAPERVPHRYFAGAGDLGIEIKIHQQLERGDGVGFELGDGHQQLLLELGGEELQGRDQQRGFGIEVKTHDTGRHFRDCNHFLDSGARRTMDMQRRNTRIDQPPALPIVGGARAPDRRPGLFAARAHL